ncbi:MAG: histidinol-phosphatase HisJ [Mariprofundaceae bacterium]
MKRYMPVPDYHMHTPRCNHARGSVSNYAEAAVAVGLTEIGMSDHSPMPGGFDAAWRMSLSELDSYLREVELARDAFASQLTIRVGLEADFHPGTEKEVEEMIASYDWDYIIGSVHFINDWAFDNPDEIGKWEQQDVEKAYCDYYALIGQSATTGMFDIIGHPDLIKKFGHRPPDGSDAVAQAVSMMLEDVKKAGCALEVSSAGLRKPIAEIYPHESIIAEAANLEIPFAFGSDAHAPNEVGHAMDACLDLLKRHGIQEVCAFDHRQCHQLPIQEIV